LHAIWVMVVGVHMRGHIWEDAVRYPADPIACTNLHMGSHNQHKVPAIGCTHAQRRMIDHIVTPSHHGLNIICVEST
jgi:hypothetical protein